MGNKNNPDPFFRITHRKNGRGVKICLGPYLNDSLRYLRYGSINDLGGKILSRKYDEREIEKEIKIFEDKISKFAYYAKNRSYIAYGNGVKDQKALENTFKLNIYIGMALQELRDILQNIVDKEKNFSSEKTRMEEIRNEILKIKIKLVNSILDLIYNENLPPANALEELKISSDERKLEWVKSIICLDKDNEYGSIDADLVNDVISKSKCGCEKEEAEFKVGETRKYAIPANMKTKVVIEKGLNNKKGPQVVVGIEVNGTKEEKDFYLFDDFTNRKIKMFKKNIDDLFNRIVKQKDDPINLREYKIALASLRDELILFVFTIEGEVKKARRDYKKIPNSYGKCAIDEKAVEVSRMLHIKFVELFEDMRVLLLRYVNGGINLEELLTGYLERRAALREYIAKEILKVDLSKSSILDFINDEVGAGESSELYALKIEDPKLKEMRNSYIKEKERLKKHVSEEISRKGSIFDRLYVKFKEKEIEMAEVIIETELTIEVEIGIEETVVIETETGTEAGVEVDKYFNPHDDFVFSDDKSEKYIKKIKERAKELAKRERDINEAYIKACEEAIRIAVEEEDYGEEISFPEKLTRWKMNQKLLLPPDPDRAEKEWLGKIAKVKKEMPPDKGPMGEDINTDVSKFADAEEFINYGGEGLNIGKKSLITRIENIHRNIVPTMERRGEFTASLYIGYMTTLERAEKDPDVESEYLQKVIELMKNVRPTEGELKEHINSITIGKVEGFIASVNDEIERFSRAANSAAVQSLQEDENVKKLKQDAFKKKLFEKLEKVIMEVKKDTEKIKSIKSIYFMSLISEEDIESAIKNAKEELEKLK